MTFARNVLMGALLMLTHSAAASSIASPPKSVMIVAFEDVYDLSLLANTVSDLGMDTTFIVHYDENDYYEHLVQVDVRKFNASLKAGDSKDTRAVKFCKGFLTSNDLLRHIRATQPTFVIFPGIRHDACLLPWTLSIPAIPIIWARGHYEELYVFVKTGMALPIHESGILQSFVENLSLKYILYSLEKSYVAPAQRVVQEEMPQADTVMTNLYSNVELVLWGADPILRINSAPLTPLVTEIGCHHCRGPQPLPTDLQKELVEFRGGVIVVLLDKEHEPLIRGIAQKVPNDRQGMTVMWKNKSAKLHNKPNNLFIHDNVDRQDLIGYARTRVVLCHCTDSEFLESAFHGTPMICFPRNMDEKRNAVRAAELGFAHIEKIDATSDSLSEFMKEIYTGTKYRENARSVSQAIRDRSNHAMDRIQYWLGYTARHYGEKTNNLLMPKMVSTYSESVQTIVGFLIGVFFTTLATILFFISQSFAETKKKEQKKRHRK